MKKTCIAIAVLLLGIDCNAASFDCNKASTFIEKAICKDAELSTLDSELMGSYKLALEKSGNPNDLKEGQKSWLKNVRNVCQDSTCLKKVYQERISTLKQSPAASSKSNAPKVVKKFTYSEKGYKGTMEISEISACEITPNQLGCASETLLTAHISTLHVASVSDCELSAVENPSTRISSSSKTQVTFIPKEGEGSENNFTIVFSGKSADITNGDLTGLCGLQGTILGHWVPAK